MSRLRPVEARKVVRLLARHGFQVVGQAGSHLKMRRDDVLLVIPMHASRPVKAGLVRKLLKQAGLDPHSALDDL